MKNKTKIESGYIPTGRELKDAMANPFRDDQEIIASANTPKEARDVGRIAVSVIDESSPQEQVEVSAA